MQKSHTTEVVLLSAVQLGTDSNCVAVFKSPIPYSSETVSLHFRAMSLYLLTKNCTTKIWKISGSAALLRSGPTVWITSVLYYSCKKQKGSRFATKLSRNQATEPCFHIFAMIQTYTYLYSSKLTVVSTKATELKSVFPPRKFYTKQMFVLLRIKRMRLRNHVDTQTVKRSRRWKSYAMCIYTVLNLKCWKCARMK